LTALPGRSPLACHSVEGLPGALRPGHDSGASSPAPLPVAIVRSGVQA